MAGIIDGGTEQGAKRSGLLQQSGALQRLDHLAGEFGRDILRTQLLRDQRQEIEFPDAPKLVLSRRRFRRQIPKDRHSTRILRRHHDDPALPQRLTATEQQRVDRALARPLHPIDDIDLAAIDPPPGIGLDEIGVEFVALFLRDPLSKPRRQQHLSSRHRSLHPQVRTAPFIIRFSWVLDCRRIQRKEKTWDRRSRRWDPVPYRSNLDLTTSYANLRNGFVILHALYAFPMYRRKQPVQDADSFG